MFNQQIKLHGYTKKAISETIRICKEKDILKEYLEKREVEVITIMDNLFNQEEVTKMMLYEERIEAEKRGAYENAMQTAKRFLAMGNVPLEVIATGTGITIAELEKLRNKIN